MLPRAARFAGGLALGIALWWIATPAYNRLLCAATEPLLHIDRRLAAAALVPQERSVFVTSSTPLPTSTIPADQLTYNVILLFALFAAEGPATRGAYMRALAIAALILIAAHCITLVIAIESTYAARQGAWSELHYGEAAASFWLTAELVMRIVGMFGVVFASWWALAHSKSVST